MVHNKGKIPPAIVSKKVAKIIVASLTALFLILLVVCLIPTPPKEEKNERKVKTTFPVQRFELGKPGEWVMTVTNLDTVTWQVAHYKLWANKPYRAVEITTDGKRREYAMPSTIKYYHGEPTETSCLEIAATESGTLVFIQREK